jgi:hypothetical protein
LPRNTSYGGNESGRGVREMRSIIRLKGRSFQPDRTDRVARQALAGNSADFGSPARTYDGRKLSRRGVHFVAGLKRARGDARSGPGPAVGDPLAPPRWAARSRPRWLSSGATPTALVRVAALLTQQSRHGRRRRCRSRPPAAGSHCERVGGWNAHPECDSSTRHVRNQARIRARQLAISGDSSTYYTRGDHASLYLIDF